MKRIAFGWYGGKFSHLDWLLPLLPQTHHFVEPFGGSAAVLLNRPPSMVETYNDLDGEVVNFFRVLRGRQDELVRAIGLSPFSREEFEMTCQRQAGLEPLERARRFYILARQTQMGLAQVATSGRWNTCRDSSRAGMSAAVSKWLGSVDSLPCIAKRLLRVQIENRPALEVIRRYDSPTTLFYCDPPYPHESRADKKAYAHEMDEQQHQDLAAALASVQGKVAVSGYACELMDRLYPAPKWFRTPAPAKTAHSSKTPRQEILWTNYPTRLADHSQDIKSEQPKDRHADLFARHPHPAL